MKRKILIVMVVMTALGNTHIVTKANESSGVMTMQQNQKILPNFNTKDIRGCADITSSQLRNVVPESMKPICNDIVYYSNHYGVNALAVCSIIRLESGNNTSKLATTKNNLGGITDGKGSYRTFSTKSQCIEYMVKLLKNEYLNPNGKYHNGYSLRHINVLYCPDDKYDWSNKVTSMANTMLANIKKM